MLLRGYMVTTVGLSEGDRMGFARLPSEVRSAVLRSTVRPARLAPQPDSAGFGGNNFSQERWLCGRTLGTVGL
jgi:hypothetical protein